MKKTKTTIALYVISVILLLLGSVQLFQAIEYIYSYLSAGSISLTSDFFTITSYISQACLMYYCFAILFYIIGKWYKIYINNIVKQDEE